MADATNRYECMFILNTAIGEENVAALIGKFKTLIEQNGTLESVEEWGNKRLAYPINDLNEGYYVLCYFMSGPEFPAEMQRIVKITDGVIRALIIRKES